MEGGSIGVATVEAEVAVGKAGDLYGVYGAYFGGDRVNGIEQGYDGFFEGNGDVETVDRLLQQEFLKPLQAVHFEKRVAVSL